MRALALAALMATAPVGVAKAAIRIALPAPATAPCAALPAAASPTEKAYFALLARRMKTEVLACPMADRAAAARALAAGGVDLAVLDGASYPLAAGKARAILTVRPEGALSRVPAVLAVRARETRGLPALKSGVVVYAGRGPAAYANPKKALTDHLGPHLFARETFAVDAEGALAALRAGRADAAVVHGGTWYRQCRGVSPADKPCADLKALWQGRPRATLAVVARKDLPEQTRFRLIGIHVAMHLEDPAAFAWARAWTPGAAEFEAAEAEALTQRPLAP
ncbi:MAG TPA: PhnD/SsuA/transferrin family substrate-binding protein [Phenylobacterium sp.]|nr:PhnD/SsuA/transferrin family substrate-binding protein [Phenylobacterium sp.]